VNPSPLNGELGEGKKFLALSIMSRYDPDYSGKVLKDKEKIRVGAKVKFDESLTRTANEDLNQWSRQQRRYIHQGTLIVKRGLS
jgi:hypothetical protein